LIETKNHDQNTAKVKEEIKRKLSNIERSSSSSEYSLSKYSDDEEEENIKEKKSENK